MRCTLARMVQEDPEYVFRFPEPDPVSPPILGFNDVDFNYPKGPTLFSDLNFGLDMESRLAIVGPNGVFSMRYGCRSTKVLAKLMCEVLQHPIVRLNTRLEALSMYWQRLSEPAARAQLDMYFRASCAWSCHDVVWEHPAVMHPRLER